MPFKDPFTRPRISQRRHPVAALERVRVDDGAGGSITSWQAIGRILWAHLEPTSEDAGTFLGGEQVRGEFSLTIPYLEKIANARPSDLRFQYGGRVFKPDGPPKNIDGEADRYLEFRVDEVQQLG